MTARAGGAAVAAYGLAGTFHSLDEVRDWRTISDDVARLHLCGLLLTAVEQGDVPANHEQRAALLEKHITAMSGVLLLDDLLRRTYRTLTVAGVACRALKGSAVAHLDYPSPELRSYGDVDLLVQSDDFDVAVSLLTRDGTQRVYAPPRPGWDRRFGKGVLLRTPEGLEIDLHRTLCTPPLGLRIDLGDLWSSTPESFVVGGQVIEALPRELRLLNAAYSASVADTTPKPSTLRDIAQLTLHDQLDGRLVRDTAAHWQGQAVLAFAINAAWTTLRIADVTLLSHWARHYRPSADEQRELALYQNRRSTETARAIATARMLPGVRTRADYLWSLAKPAAEFRRQSRRSAAAKIGDGLRDLRRARRGSQ